MSQSSWDPLLSGYSLKMDPDMDMDMDMDMDIDIPLPDELELLEASYRHHEDYIDHELPQTYSDKEDCEESPYLPVPKPLLDIPHKAYQPASQLPDNSPSILDFTTNGHKRSKSEGLDSPFDSAQVNSGNSEEKRRRIVESRIELEEDWLRFSPLGDNNHVKGQLPSELEEKTVFRYPSEIDGDFIPITAPGSGERVYAKIRQRGSGEPANKFVVNAKQGGLVGEPINDLLLKVEQEAFTKTLEASDEGQNEAILPKTSVIHEQLWVDKYAPRSFTELLSDEHTNREVLLWLKQWDSCVFGSKIRNTSDEVLSSLRRHSSIAQKQKRFNSYFYHKNRDSKSTKDNFRRSTKLDTENSSSEVIQDSWSKNHRLSGPLEHKILLLCGPPGLGKTTLAHVAAKHCGYRVVEVNASDDRSSSAVESKIIDAVEMNSVMADSKPKCLIIDEIDGSLGEGKGAVDVILKMVSLEKKSDSKRDNLREENSGSLSAKKQQKSFSLSRPVICICNDLYAPALRALRLVSKVHVFVQPTVSRIVSRLKYICNKEGMKTSSAALSALAEYTECDVRSCLNTLQFLNRKKETLNELEISSQVIGRKDIVKSVFDVWKEIFHKRKIRQQRSYHCSGSPNNEFEILQSLMSSRGDHDLILDGIHENILQLHYHDPMMQKTVKCIESLGHSDIIHQYTMRTQQMALYVYRPFSAIIVHRLVAQVQKPNIEWPKSNQRCRTMLLENMDILRSWHDKIAPHISRHLSIKSCIEDSLSLFLHIVSPPTLRPVAMHLLSDKEKDDLTHLISTMVSYAISYKNTKCGPLSNNRRPEATLDGSLLAFEPPIDNFINFQGYQACHHVLALAMKQVLIHEVEKQKILQLRTSRSVDLSDGHKDKHAVSSAESHRELSSKTDDGTICIKDRCSSIDLSNLRRSKPSISKSSLSMVSSKSAASSVDLKFPVVMKKKTSVSSSCFFDRFRKLSGKGHQNLDNAEQKEIKAEKDIRPILFKFNEGFTNAIKRPVRIRDFLMQD